MAFAPIRRQRLNQARGDGIDWSNPITQGLCFCVNGNQAMHTSSQPVATGAKSGIVTRKGAGYGFGSAYGSGTSDIVSVDNGADPIVSTLISVALINGLGGTSLGRFVDCGVGSPEIMYMDSLLGFRYSRSFTSGLRSRTWGSSISALFGTVCVIAASYDASNTTNLPTLYLNGKKETGGTTPDAAPTGTVIPRNSLTNIGNRQVDLVRNFDGVILSTLRFARILSDKEHEILANNPWQVFL